MICVEIERKFLVKKESLPDLNEFSKLAIVQHYLDSTNPTIRIRQTNMFHKQKHNNSVDISQANYVLTMKGQRKSISRHEFNFNISKSEFFGMLKLVDVYYSIYKTRYLIPIENSNLRWEVDVFHSKNEGLIIAEIEVPNEDFKIEIPEWCDLEISQDDSYSNFALAKNPYKERIL